MRLDDIFDKKKEEHKLTQSQQVAMNKFDVWCKTDNVVSFYLKGAAGTGKSFITRLMINHFEKTVRDRGGTIVTAPTHKAKKVIAGFTHKEATTLASFLGMSPNIDLEDINLEDMKFVTKYNKPITCDILYVDECSMLSMKFVKDLITACKNQNCRIVFIGDSAQLPPVKDKPFDMTRLVDDYAELKEVVRTKSDAIKLATYVRQHSNEANLNLTPYLCDSVKLITKDEFKQLITTSYDPAQDAFLCYTNKCVKTWNTFIKDVDNPSIKWCAEGDILMAYANSGGLQNSDTFLISKIVEETINVNWFGEIRKGKTKDNETLDVITCYQADGEKIYILKHTSYNTYAKIFERVKNYCIKYKSWKYIFKIVDNGIFLTSSIRAADKNIPRSIDHGRALTVHKSQGSTYRDVYVDIRDIYSCKSVALRNKLLYVACSRNSRNLIFVR